MASVYLDHAATSPVAPEALNRLHSLLSEGVANSSSAHAAGVKAAALLSQAREIIATKLGCETSELLFCSGGTEANNWVLQRVAMKWNDANPGKKCHLLTLSTEHSSVTNTAEWLRDLGMAEWDQIPVDREGGIKLDALKKMIRPETALVSISHGNNEIGTLQDLDAVGNVCLEQRVLFHVDACQSFCHEPFSIKGRPIDFMTLSGHKVRAPKGVGALFIRNGVEIIPLVFGGKQERGLRPGTTSVELACSFATAVQTWDNSAVDHIRRVREYAVSLLKTHVPKLEINGREHGATLGHVLSFTVLGTPSKFLQRELSNLGVACSTGAACGTGKSDASAVLLALGHDAERAHQIRISFSPTTKKAEIDFFVETLKSAIQRAAN